MLIWITLLLLLFWIAYPMVFVAPSAPSVRRLRHYEDQVHPYSGLDPATWSAFVTNLRRCDATIESDPAESAASLYRAVDNIYDLGLFVERADDSEHIETLGAIAQQLAMEGETAISREASLNGISFAPKHLNGTVPDETDVDPDFRRSRARDFRNYENTLGTGDTGASAI